jgi:YidC/Oxa1 family membrane protein insertase
MNKSTINTIVGMLLIVGIFAGYYFFTRPSASERARMQHQQDSLTKVAIEKLKKDSIAQLQAKKNKDSAVAVNQAVPGDTTAGNDSLARSEKLKKAGAFSLSMHGDDKPTVITTDLVKLKLSARGGFISYVELLKFKTWDQKPLILFNNDSAFKMNFYGTGNMLYTTSDFKFRPYCEDKRFTGKDSIALGSNDSLVISMRLYPNANDSTLATDRYIEFRYVIRGNNYMLGFDISMVKMGDIIPNTSAYAYLEWNMNMRQLEKEHKIESQNTTIYFKPVDDKVNYLSETSDDEKEFKAGMKWVSFKQQFFSSTLIAKENFKEAKVTVKEDKDSAATRHLKTMKSELTMVLSGTDKTTIPMQLYFGPNQYKTLTSYNLDLERQIPLGWSFFLMQWINRFAVIPIFNWLEGYGINYGIIILILTIILKIVLFPIAYRTYKSSAKMRVLKPEVDEINKKFPKKEDAMKKQQATMALYKKAGVSPMAGCIPLLLQMPILISLYRFFPASIELRQQSFLWANDLSSYDSIVSWSTQIPIISSWYGNHVSLFTLLMTITTIIYTWLNNQLMGSTNQMPGMKWMMYLMPIMFLGFFNSFASGLSYYYFLANIFTFLQMFVIRWFIDEDKIHAQIQENKKKPVKKSGFQARLEAMAKKSGYNAK